MNRADLLRACFGSAELVTGEPLEVAAGDNVLAHLDIVWGGVAVAGQTVAVAGLANVCTEPGWRGRGLASALIELAHALAVRRHVEYAALFSDYRDFYRRFGYQHPDGAGTKPLLVVELAGKPWPAGTVDTGTLW